jgi:hypothetical protein
MVLQQDNANRRIPVSHIYYPRDWTWVPHDGKQTGSPLDQWDMVWMQWDYRLSTGLPPSSRLCWLWRQKEDLQRAWNWDRRAVWDQVRLSHCRHDSLVTIRDEARLGRGHNDQSRWGYLCSETILVLHMYSPGDWTRVPHDGKKTGSSLDQWDMVWMQWDCRLSTVLCIFNPYHWLSKRHNSSWHIQSIFVDVFSPTFEMSVWICTNRCKYHGQPVFIYFVAL